MNPVLTWAQAHPLPSLAAVLLLLAAAVLLARAGRKALAGRAPAAVLVASLAAMACTAYSADTSWRFAADYLGMTSTSERAAMFAAAELALFACALMARQNLRSQGAPGAPGMLVWVITGVQVIPAYSESGLVGGTVRGVVGPVLAALLWHLAMGIELRHAKPGADSSSLPALLARELRERLLSYLGLATRDRTAEQITRDRWTVRAVGLAAKLADMAPDARGRARIARRLSVAVGKAQAGASGEQRQKLLDLLAARRHAASLATIDLPSPWQAAPKAVEVTVEQVDDDQQAPLQVSLDLTQPSMLHAWKDAPKFPRDESAPRWTVTKPVMPQVPALESGTFWLPSWRHDLTTKVTTAVPAEQPRQVVTETIVRTPSELRREARRLNREAVRSTNRPVTIKTLQEELGLSRREATDLRREVVGSERS
ncbi:hypothetical protein [Streptomyces griseosporeus]|uniref:hypothetical protein n=1 Tax=Streptomyces griseosporeus TaxID=1910 RepID=UPI00167DA75F|nr:hypothetical protein [Streptomyces griseosporeus]GHF57884.1 hypothetical protein GCM10018783_29080 [Streptomyces griseosporeus]